jgi:hypothetical protein
VASATSRSRLPSSIVWWARKSLIELGYGSDTRTHWTRDRAWPSLRPIAAREGFARQRPANKVT